VLKEIDDVDEELAKAMYRLGFRALEEIAEAAIEELVTIEGVTSEQRAQELKVAAERTMERLRRDRIHRASSQIEPLSERDKLRFVPGVGTRTVQLLEEAGYRTVQDLAREDADRLAIRTGLGIKKARQIQVGASYFLSTEAREIEDARRHATAAAAAAAAAVQPSTSGEA
jgi:N utilization substance protein A